MYSGSRGVHDCFPENGRLNGAWADAPHADGLADAAHEAAFAGRWEEALAVADEALARARNHVSALALRAIALARLGYVDQALEAAATAIKCDPAHGYGYTAMGIAHFMAGDSNAAIKEFEYAERLLHRSGLLPFYIIRARSRSGGGEDVWAAKQAVINTNPALADAAPGFWL